MTASSSHSYKNGVLHCEAVSLAALAEEVGTPYYAYSLAALRQRYRLFAEAVAGLNGRICYAVKANPNLAIIAAFAREGAGADVVSEGELRRALIAGVPPERIVFSGVGRTEAELAFAVDRGIGQINLESVRDLRLLSAIASRQSRRMPIAIRVNPDVDAHTHAKISTGKSENKFGIDIDLVFEIYREAAALPGIDVAGIALHIGSQLLDLSPFDAAFDRVAALLDRLRMAGIAIRHLDLGGGIGVPYRGEAPPSLDQYVAMITRHLGRFDCAISFEPGRFLVAEAGLLVSRVLDLKEGVAKRFLIVDAAMNDLVRPTLYDAFHPIFPVTEPAADHQPIEVDVVGPICETGDYFAQGRSMAPLRSGDLIAIGMAGAYAASMGSTYNTRPLPPEILVDGAEWELIRARQTYDELLGMDRIPAWLK